MKWPCRHIAVGMRLLLVALLLFSMNQSLHGVCPHIRDVTQETVKGDAACCKSRGKDAGEQEKKKDCCSDSRHFCSCCSPLTFRSVPQVLHEMVFVDQPPASMPDEVLHYLSREPAIPPPKG